MLLTLRALLLVLFISAGVQGQTRTLALYSGSAQGLNPESRLAMRTELQRLLAPAGLDIVWKNFGERRTGEDFELIAVVSFEGLCSAAQPVLLPVRASLADTSISEGRILPFFQIDCSRVIQMLGPHTEPFVVGRALARVMAHEIYHIVARTADHHDSGVAKASFSVRDLTNPRFEFDPWSLARMRPPAVARASDNSETDTR